MSSYTLGDHVRASASMSDSDDSKSNASSVSSARVAEACPCCKKEMQARVLFNHLRKLHPDYVKIMYGVWNDEQMDKLIADNAPFPIEWIETDDFEEETTRTLWGCLGCNNTFVTENKAVKHCNDKKCKKDHNANLRRIKKEEQQDKAERKKKVMTDRQKWLARTPEQIRKCILNEVYHYTHALSVASAKIARFLSAMNYERPQDFIFFLKSDHAYFVDDKRAMEKHEYAVEEELTMWQRKYEDILPLLWTETEIVTHEAYDEIEKAIHHRAPVCKY
jgi:hypothetical protein